MTPGALRALRLAAVCLLVTAGALSGTALNVTETRLFSAPATCSLITSFDIAANGRDYALGGLGKVGSDAGTAVWLNGNALGHFDRITELGFTAQNSFWFGSVDSARSYLSFNGHRSRAWDNINWRSLLVSPDGSTPVYIAGRNGKHLVVTGDQAGKEYASISLPVFGADGKAVLYAAAEGREPDSLRRFIVVSGREGSKRNCEFLGWVKQSSNGTKLAYAVLQNGRAFVVENERAGAKYDDVGWLEYAPGAARLVYAARSRGKWFLVKDGYPLRERYDDVSFPVFSPDGGKLAFVGREGNQEFVVSGNRRGARFDRILLPGFSPDSRHLGYLARKGAKWLVVTDDKPGRPYDEVAWLTWGPDGRDYAFRAKTGGRYCVVVNGAETGSYDEVGQLWFTPGGRRLQFGARQQQDIILATVALP